VIEVSVLVEGLGGLAWPTWKRLVEAVEPWGFAGWVSVLLTSSAHASEQL
jgi:hypothetical protein